VLIFYTAIIAFSVLLGFFYYESLKKKKDYFKSVVDFLFAYKNNICYLQKNLPELIETLAPVSQDFLSTISSFKEKLKKEEQVLFLPQYLTILEKEELTDMFNNLGLSDSITQLDFVSRTINLQESHLKEAEDKFKKYAPLSIKLALALGILLVILLI